MTGRTAARSSWLAIGGLTLLAAILRFATLDRQSMWSDEAMTVALLRLDLLDMLRTIAETEATPPLYYVVAWGWTRVFGDGEVGLRSLSALAGTAIVPIAYAAGAALFGRRGALAAAALASVSPALVWYSQEARSYALAVLLTGASFAAFARLLRSSSTAGLVAWAALSSLALATHYFAAFVVVPEAVWLLATLRSRTALVSVSAAGAAGLALLPLALAQRGHGFVEGLAGADSEGFRLVVVVKQILVGVALPYDRAVAAAIALLLGAALLVVLPHADRAERRALLVASTVGGAPIVVPLVLGLADLDYLNARNALLGFVPLAVLLGGGLSIGERRVGSVAQIATGAALLAVTISVTVDSRYHRPDWRGFAQAVRAARHPQVLAVAPDHQGWFARVPLRLYFPEARAIDAAHTFQPQEFDAVSRRSVDRATPEWIEARELLVGAVGWSQPRLPRALLRRFTRVEDVSGNGYTYTRYRSDAPVRLRTEALVVPQAAVLVVAARR